MIIVKDKSYSFDDEVSIGFSYSSFNKNITINFEAFYENKKYINKRCSLVIEKWTEAKSKIYNTKKIDNLEKYLGVFSIIIDIENKDDQLNIIVNTIDDRYIELYFKNPEISLEVLD